MNITNRIVSTVLFLLLFILSKANTQEDTIVTDKKQEKIKKGWTFGAVPAITYNSDLGLQYGLVVNFFNYGDGTTYPKYHHNLYFEWSRYTKGSGINMIKYDSEHLIPGVRVSGELSYLTEQALDFYGFNGFETVYNKDLMDDESDSYISRMFYRMDRRMFKARAEFQGPLSGRKLRWMAGMEYSHIKTGDVDIEKLNKGKDEEDRLPDTTLLFEYYKDWGIIPAGQADGGNNNLIKLGLIYDTRDFEANPMKGVWTELQLLLAPSFIGNSDGAYTRLIFTHRQYFTIVPKILFCLPAELSGQINRHYAVLHASLYFQFSPRLYA